MPITTFESSTAILYLDEEGVLHVILKPGAHIALRDAEETMAAIERIAEGRPVPVFVDMTHIRSMERDARKYYGGEATAAACTAIALLTVSPISRVIGNFYVRFSEHALPVQMFNRERDALAWLKEYRS